MHPIIFMLCFFFASSCSPKSPPLSPVEQQQAFDFFAKHLSAIGGAQSLQQRQSLSFTGTVRDVGSEVAHEYHLQRKAPNLYYIRINRSGIGIFERGFDGTTFWERTPRGSSLLSAEEQQQLQPLIDFYYDINFRQWYHTIERYQQAEFAGQLCDVVDAINHLGQKERLFFAQESGLKIGVVRSPDTEQETIVRYGHYVDQNGTLIPLSTEEKRSDVHRIWMIETFTWEHTDVDFSPPPALREQR